MSDIGALYLDEAFRSLRGHKRLADDAIAQLNDEQFFAAARSRIQQRRHHREAHGRQYALALHRLSDHRRREARPQSRPRISHARRCQARGGAQLVGAELAAGLRDHQLACSPSDLERTVTIRGEPHSVLQAINRAGDAFGLPRRADHVSWPSTGRARSGSRSASPKVRASSSTPRCWQKHKNRSRKPALMSAFASRAKLTGLPTVSFFILG